MKRQPIDLYTGPTTLVIDVSAHQGEIDWSAVAASEAMLGGTAQGRPAMAIIRTSDGMRTRPSSRLDPRAVRNLRGAHAAGLRVAAYHFVRAYYNARAQAELALEAIAVSGVPVVFVAIDVEGQPDDPATSKSDGLGAWWAPPGMPSPTTDEVLRDCDEMRAELEAHDLRVVMYSGVAWHYYIAQHRRDVARWGEVPLWVPFYTSGPRPSLPVGPAGEAWPWREWTLWQYSAKGQIAGVPGRVDLNRFRGGPEAFERWCRAGGP